MIFRYYPDTDSLYIDLSEKASVDSREVIDGQMVLDFDEEERLVGIDIYSHASRLLDLTYLEKAGVLVETGLNLKDYRAVAD
ncbi:DUF2283 domain-containing protein [Candidatus Poribacteria bacterium]|nr:DUF2283 domain-containing protein [Candidatus Poribacteria bacterium]